jgi:F-type H+-transporting ATPase subunit b
MLPQFDISFFPSQIFWLFVSFGIIFTFVNFYFFPRMRKILSERERKITKDLKFYEHNLHEIEELFKKHEAMIKNANEEANKNLKEADKKIKDFTEKRCAEVDENLNKKFSIAKQEIDLEISNFQSSLKEEVLKSAISLIEAIEGEKVSEDKIKKYIA